MEGMRQLDEIKRIENELPALGSRLAVPTPLAGRLRELPPGTNTNRPLVTLHLMQGAQEIGATRSPVVISQTDWQFFEQEFEVTGAKPARWMALASPRSRSCRFLSRAWAKPSTTGLRAPPRQEHDPEKSDRKCDPTI